MYMPGFFGGGLRGLPPRGKVLICDFSLGEKNQHLYCVEVIRNLSRICHFLKFFGGWGREEKALRVLNPRLCCVHFLCFYNYSS